MDNSERSRRKGVAIGGPMDHHSVWDKEQITFDVVADETDHPVVTVLVQTPIGPLAFMGEPEFVGRVMVAKLVHVQGAHAQAVGWPNLRVLAEAVMERMDLDELVIEGAVRTTGASPGRRPRALRFSPRHYPAPQPQSR